MNIALSLLYKYLHNGLNFASSTPKLKYLLSSPYRNGMLTTILEHDENLYRDGKVCKVVKNSNFILKMSLSEPRNCHLLNLWV